MGGFTIWQWLILIAAVAMIWGTVRVVRRTGANLLWIVPLLIPVVGAFGLLWFSYSRWPAIEKPETNPG